MITMNKKGLWRNSKFPSHDSFIHYLKLAVAFVESNWIENGNCGFKPFHKNLMWFYFLWDYFMTCPLTNILCYFQADVLKTILLKYFDFLDFRSAA